MCKATKKRTNVMRNQTFHYTRKKTKTPEKNEKHPKRSCMLCVSWQYIIIHYCHSVLVDLNVLNFMMLLLVVVLIVDVVVVRDDWW
jgi:hypothetical protein